MNEEQIRETLEEVRKKYISEIKGSYYFYAKKCKEEIAYWEERLGKVNKK